MDMDLDTVVTNLNQRRFIASRYAGNQTLKAAVLDIIGSRSVGIGGSASVDELGLYDTLVQQGNLVHCHTYCEEKDAARHAAMGAEVYLCSANAITEDGMILNVDGTGNRVAATVFGPKTVIIIAGKNKLAADVNSGIERIRRESCPNNARRLGLNTPCARTDACGDCKTPARMCNAFMLLAYPTRNVDKFYVLLSDERLGW